MYYVYSYAHIEDLVDNWEECDRLWQKIVTEGHGRFVWDEYYIFSTEESFEMEGKTFKYSYPLKEWIKNLCCDESTEIYEGFTLEHSEVMDILLGDLEDDTLGTDEFPTYADMIFHAEKPKEKVNELLVESAKVVLDYKMQEMKEAFEKFTKGLEEGTIKLN